MAPQMLKMGGPFVQVCVRTSCTAGVPAAAAGLHSVDCVPWLQLLAGARAPESLLHAAAALGA